MRVLHVLHKVVGEELKFTEIEHTYLDMENLVKGKLEMIALLNGIDLWVNKHQNDDNLSLNLITIELEEEAYRIKGDIFFAGSNGEGDSISLTPSQIAWIKMNMYKADTITYKDHRQSNSVYILILK